VSKYEQYNCQDMTSQEILLAALAELGWSQGQVEVHDEPQTLYDYTGKARPQKANLIIRRKNTGLGASNDVGFIKQADGSFSPIVSDYDTNLSSRGQRNGTVSFAETVQGTYGQIAGNKALATFLDESLPAMKLQGLVPEYATMEQVHNGSTVEIQLSY